MGLIGQTVSHYKIIEKLGAGGMGTVYKAKDTKLDRFVALKFLPPHLSQAEDEKKRFIHEAKAASALQHNNICTIHEINETADGQIFIVMEYIHGKTLKDLIATGNERGEAFPVKLSENRKKHQKNASSQQSLSNNDKINIAIQIGKGLEKAHAKKIVHRDIKPANILLIEDGVVKIVDFGLAKLAGQTKLTKTGSTLGTVTYMSPEQAQGEVVDHRTDIWALGVILYEMLTGKPPFAGDYEQAVIYSIINEEPRSITDLNSDVPPTLEQIVSRALEKDPEKRYQYIKEMLDDLESLSAGIVPEEIQSRMRKAKMNRIKRQIMAGFAIIAILFIAGIFIVPGLFHPGDAIDKSIAVVPFHYLSDEPDKQYLADGVMEAILLNLSKMKDLRVVSRTSVEQYRETDKTVNTICQELGVAYLLEGSFQKFGDMAKLIVQLIKPGKERHVWADEYDREWTDIFAIQSEVAQTVAGELQVAISPEEKQLIEKIPTTNMAAYDMMLKGEFYLIVGRDEASLNDLDRAMHYFELSIEKDPQLAGAYVGIACVWIWYQQYLVVSRDEATPKIREAVEKALELDDNLEGAYEMLAGMYIWGKWDWQAGQAALQKAIAINPNFAGAHAAYSFLLNILGQPEKAREHNELALKLDPHDSFLKYLYCQNLLFVRRYEDCISVCRESIEKNPDDYWAAEPLYWALYSTGRYEESLEAMEYYYTGYFKDYDHVFDQYEKLGYIGTLILEIDTLLAQLKSESYSPTWLVDLYFFAGNKERALYYLEQAYEMRDPNLPPNIARLSLYSLNDEPRFQELLRKMNLPMEE